MIINYTFEKRPTRDDYTVLFMGLPIPPVILFKIIGIINKTSLLFHKFTEHGIFAHDI